MVIVFEGTEQEYYMDGYLKNAFDTAKEKIKQDWDFVFCYDGVEGSGKSLKAMQDAFFCDPNLNLDNFAFTPNQFKEVIKNANKYDAIIYDEAHSGLNSRAAMTQINRSLVSMLTEIRQKNLFVFIVLPTFFDLDKYVALWRSRALIHIYTKENFERGYFAFYNVDRKKKLYLLGKKLYDYRATKPNFVGRFTKHYTIDEKEYRKRKYDALIGREKVKEDKEAQAIVENLLFERVALDDSLTHKQKIELLKMPESTYFLKLRKIKENNEL